MDFEFSKSGTVDNLDVVPEQFRSFYAQQDNKYVLADSFKGAATALDGLNGALKRARRDADEAKKNRPDLTPWLGLGEVLGLDGDVTADAVREQVATLMDKVSKGDAGKVNWDKMKDQLETAHRKALGTKDEELRAMEGTVVRYLVNQTATAAIAEHKGVPQLLIPHIASRTKVIKEGNDYVVRVVDESGDPRGNASGGFMSVADLVKEMKSDPVFGRAFESENPGSAAGAARPGVTANRAPPRQDAPLSATDKIRRGFEQGLHRR